MRDVNIDTLTDTFINYMSDDTSDRMRFLMTHFVRHMHDFVKETQLTHDEWRTAIVALTKAGEITEHERNEFVLFSDVTGLSSLVDMIGSQHEGTSSSVLGPFHILGAPKIPVGGDLVMDNEGAVTVVQGVVRTPDGKLIEGANIELWQTAENGLYSNQDDAQSEYNLRCSMETGADGRYALTTIRPAPYMVPDDGPVGELLHSMGRDAWRPSHLHFIVQAEGYRSLVTEVFPSNDQYVDRDAVFGVREDLIMVYKEQSDTSIIPDDIAIKDKIKAPFFTVDFDFVLVEE